MDGSENQILPHRSNPSTSSVCLSSLPPLVLLLFTHAHIVFQFSLCAPRGISSSWKGRLSFVGTYRIEGRRFVVLLPACKLSCGRSRVPGHCPLPGCPLPPYSCHFRPTHFPRDQEVGSNSMILLTGENNRYLVRLGSRTSPPDFDISTRFCLS